jgi:hypothetical protein
VVRVVYACVYGAYGVYGVYGVCVLAVCVGKVCDECVSMHVVCV